MLKASESGKEPPVRVAGNPDALLDSALDVVVHTLSSGRCSFMLLDASKEELWVEKARGLSPEVMSRARVKFGQSIAGIVARSRRPLLVGDLDTYPELRSLGIGGYRTNSLLSVPVLVAGEVYGVLNVADRADGKAFEKQDLITLNLLASHMALCIETSLLQAHIQRLANSDGLTGAYNHRYFQERLAEEVDRSSRFGRPVSLMMIDVNGFKSFNDRWGHLAGDSVLQEVVATLRECVRQIDLVSRYGGDEFTVVLPETDDKGALLVVTRITHSLAARQYAHATLEGLDRITVSIGLSTYPSPAPDRRELIAQADRAMYLAKMGPPPHVHRWQETG